MTRNVLELVGSFHQGGSERQAIQLSRLLSEDGTFNVFIATLDASGSLAAEIDWMDAGEIPEFKLTSFYDLNFLRQARKCAAFIRANSITVVHTHDYYSNIFGMFAASLAGVRARVASKRETASKTRSQFFLERQAFALAKKIVVNAEAVGQFLVENGVPNRKIVTIHNGLQLDRLTADSTITPEWLPGLLKGRPADNFRFVTIVANMRDEVKNHRMFLRAAKRVKEIHPNARFMLAGEGELANDLKHYADELGIVGECHFIGRCTDVGSLLSMSDVCVLSSWSEGFSNSVLEYMAAGKPVVATRVGGADEAVVEGETGYLVRSDDDEAMAGRISDLLASPDKASAFGRRGREIVESRFTPGVQLRRTLDLYSELLDGKA